MRNSPETVGRDEHLAHKTKGDILVLESESDPGFGEYLYAKDLTDYIQNSKTQIEVVFISSCQSEFAGKIFYEAGIKHVICIRENHNVRDEVAIQFEIIFYETLFL
jgi:hypothetical protein